MEALIMRIGETIAALWARLRSWRARTGRRRV